MAKDIKVYDLLISCPSDVSEYVELGNYPGKKNDPCGSVQITAEVK